MQSKYAGSRSIEIMVERDE